MLTRISILAFTIAFLPVKPSFAAERFTVTGEPAQALYTALVDAGAQSRHGAGALYVRAANVSCAEGGGIVFLPMHCSLDDELAGKQIRTDGDLARALEDAGVKASAISMGELHETRVGASFVACSRNFEGVAACSIEL